MTESVKIYRSEEGSLAAELGVQPGSALYRLRFSFLLALEPGADMLPPIPETLHIEIEDGSDI